MDEEKDKRLSRTMLNFKDSGVVLSASEVRSIEKVHKFEDKPKSHIEYGIAINKGVTPSQQVSKTDVYLWYLKEEVRDRAWELMMNTLSDEGMNFIDI